MMVSKLISQTMASMFDTYITLYETNLNNI